MQNRILQKHPALRGVFQTRYFFNNKMRKPAVLALTLLLLGAMAGCAGKTRVTGTAFLMDTIVEYQFTGPEDSGKKVEQALRDFEEQCSLYMEDSEITALNQAAGKEYVRLSPRVYDLLARCTQYGAESGGVFDVTIAPLVKLWNITGKNPQVPPREKISALLPLVDYRDILLKEGSAMLAREGQMVDLGGIAKGYACNIARETALESGVKRGYVSIGGNIMVIGKKESREDYRFGLRDPRGGPNDYLAVVTLPDSTIATSGDYERYFERDGVRYHHILDPATGAPAQTDLMSVSVFSPDGAYADYMSTYLFLKGRAFALERLNSLDCGLVLIDRDRNIYVSDSIKGRFRLSDQTGTYRYEAAS